MSIGSESAKIKVLGVGGGGGNAVQHMANANIKGVEFACLNTDAQALNEMTIGHKIQIGNTLTKGLGAGANPSIGREAACESQNEIQDIIRDADMVFVTAGMGGGTGTGAAPIVAEIARSMGILTVGVVTKPFPFEGKKRMVQAEEGIALLKENVDSLITIPNARLLDVLGKGVSLVDAFAQANNVLLGAVQGISDLIVRPGMINVDFADVKTVMSEMGISMMGTGVARGENRAIQAAEMAIYSPLLDNVELNQARGILVNVTANSSLELGEFSEIGEMVQDLAADDATVVVGTVVDETMEDEIRVTLVATGLENGIEEHETQSQAQYQQPVHHAHSARPVRHPGTPSNQHGHVTSPHQPSYATQRSIQSQRTIQPQQVSPTQMLREEQRVAAPTHAPQQAYHKQTDRDMNQAQPKRQFAPAEEQRHSVQRTPKEGLAPGELDQEFLDIPAFLRRQND